MTYETELEARGRMWEESEAGESGGPSRQSASSRGLNSEVKMREKAGEKGGELKSERDIEIPLFQAKQGRHLKKSESVVGAHRPVKKYSEDDFERTNLILNSEKSTRKAKVRGARLWASLSICWGSNAQVKSLNFDCSTNIEYFKVGSGNTLPVWPRVEITHVFNVSDVQQGEVPIRRDCLLCGSPLEKPVTPRGTITIPCLPRVSDHQRYRQNIYPSHLLVSMCYQMSENRCQTRLYLKISYQMK